MNKSPLIKLNHQCGFMWHNENNCFAKGFLFDEQNKLYKDADLLLYFSDVDTLDDFNAKLLAANGQFSVILNFNDTVMTAVDRLRTFPLFYYYDNEQWIIGDEVNCICRGKKEWNNNAKIIFDTVGYVTGNETLVSNVFQVQAGEYIVIKNGNITHSFYYKYDNKIAVNSYLEAKEKLLSILDSVSKRMIKLLDNRPVFIPLSGGFDSRLVAYLLYKNKYKNVTCFTYGVSCNNDELNRSKAAAEKLGFRWIFVDYNKVGNINYIDDEKFMNYYSYSAQYTSKFYFSEYFAAAYFKNNLKIPSDAVFIPGHSGDLLAGSHLRPYMLKYSNKNELIDDIMSQHFSLVISTFSKRKVVRKALKEQLKNVIHPLYKTYENWDIKERQAKYIVNSCRLWEYYGFQFMLPLWDKELFDFFASLPFDFKLNKRLYNDVLCDLFKSEDLLFEEDTLMNLPQGMKENMKLWVKRHLKFIQLKKNIYAADYFNFQYFTEPMRIENRKSKWHSVPRHYNAVIAEWYLNQLEKNN